jgi:tetratricopeptide (TPR) repeat protein
MNHMNRIIPSLCLIVGLALLYPVQRWMDDDFPRNPTSEDVLYLSSGETIKKMSLGLDGLVADIYWIRTVQYFGNKVIESRQPLSASSTQSIRMESLAPLLNIITDLDPHHIQAYRFGAIFLPERDMPAAVALLERGIHENSDEWRLYQDLGYIYWQAKDYDKAAEAYERGSQIPGAAWWMRDIAGFMRIKGGSREAARAIYEKYLESDDQKIRDQANSRLKQLLALDELDVINALMEGFKKETGRCPDNLKIFASRLRTAGFTLNNDLQPVDPDGVPYVIEPAICKANTHIHSTIPRE